MRKDQVLAAMGKKAAWLRFGASKAEQENTLLKDMEGIGGWDSVATGIGADVIGGFFGQTLGGDPKVEPQNREGMEFASEYLVYYPRNKLTEDYTQDVTSNLLEFRYLNVRDLLARFFLTSHFERPDINNWRSRCVGMPSLSGERGPGGRYDMHMPMLDYDGSNVKSKIRKDVKLLQQSFDLGDAWVYKTRRGYHVYFLTDTITKELYMDILQQVQCCKGFKKCTRDRGYAVLRVSAKYTDFDIGLQYVLASKTRSAKRVTRKGHLIQRMIQMGQECGTHLASLFPDQALYAEDEKEWRAKTAKAGKRIRKVKHLPHAEGIAVAAPPAAFGDPVHHWTNNNVTTGETVTITTTAPTSTANYNAFDDKGMYMSNPAAAYGPYSTTKKYKNE